ncbi:MAG: IS110 family transposase [Acidimicrobiia bacterium]|nr:IS110 family transposase [Acidimicrobiia bacterium]
MSIVGALDVHRAQNTFEYADTATGELTRGRIGGTRAELRAWLACFDSDDNVAFAVEGCTGWRYVVEELAAAGIEAHVAEPAETAWLKSPKKRAKTDRADAAHLRLLLMENRIPESWIPPSHVLEVRTLARLYHQLMTTRRSWLQRIHAQLFHQGAPSISALTSDEGHQLLAAADLSEAGHRYVTEAIGIVDDLTRRIETLRGDLKRIGRHQPGCIALQTLWGIGPLLATIIWAEIGDTRRFTSSKQAVRFTGLDITVNDSDGHGPPGKLARQGSPTLRWALVEAAQHASKRQSPDHQYYRAARRRIGASRAALSVARKHTRRIHHILQRLGDDAWTEIPPN